MSQGTACYCINPHCSERENFYGVNQLSCLSCGTSLMIQPQRFLLKKPLYGVESNANSQVFEIEDFNFNSDVYPKIIKILNAPFPAIALDLFKQEGEILRELRELAIPRAPHQPYLNISITPKNHPRPQQLHCLVMEQIKGETLEEFVEQNGKISIEVALDWLRQSAQLLQSIHSKNIIHRDIKPSNIIVRAHENFPHGELVFIDFGTARRTGLTYLDKLGKEESLTKIISLGYTAPEQQDGHCILRSDLYALGNTFIYLLTGYTPPKLESLGIDWQTQFRYLPLQKLLLALTEKLPEKRLPNTEKLLENLHQIFVMGDSFWRNIHWKLRQNIFTKKKAIAIGLICTTAIGMTLARNPLTSALNHKGNEAYQAKKYETAKQYYQWAIYLKPKFAQAQYGLGKSCAELKQVLCAENHYKKSISIDQNRSVVTFRSWADLGQLLMLYQRSGDAISALSQALLEVKSDHEKAIVSRHLAAAYFDLQDFPKAQNYLNQSLGINQSHPKSLCLQQLVNQEIENTTDSHQPAAFCFIKS